MFKKGRTRYKDGTVYEGTYKQERRDGTGTCHYPDGSVYEGTWLNDVREGRGILTYKDGSYYEGEWKNNLRHGKGVLDIVGEAHYEGTFECGDYHGSGTLRTPAFYYVGAFIKGVFHGSGELNTEEYTYKGEFSDGQQTGQGRIEYKDGTIYIGGFLDGLYSGPGRLLLPDGGIYEAQFSSGKIEDRAAHYVTKESNKYPSRHTINTILGLLEPTSVSIFSDYLLCYEGNLYTSVWNARMEPLMRFLSSCISPRLIVSYIGSIKVGVLDGSCEVEYDNQFTFSGDYVAGVPSNGTITFNYTGDLAILESSEADIIQHFKLVITFSKYSRNVFHGACNISIELKDRNNNTLTYKSKFVLDTMCQRQGDLDIICNDLYFSGTVQDDQITGEGTLSISFNPALRPQNNSVCQSSAVEASVLESFLQATSTSRLGRSTLPGKGLAVVYKGAFVQGLRSGRGTQQAGNLYHFVGRFEDDMFLAGILTDYMCLDKVTNEHIARRTIGSFKHNMPQCPVLVEVDTFRYRVYCGAPNAFPSLVTSAMRKLCLKTSLSISRANRDTSDDPSDLMTVSQLQPIKRANLSGFSPSYFVSFFKASPDNLETIVAKILAGEDVNGEHAVLTDVQTCNLKSVTLDPSNLTSLVPQFYAGTLEDMRLTGTGAMFYQFPDVKLAVLATGSFVDGYLDGSLELSVFTHGKVESEYATLSQIEAPYLVCNATIAGTYSNSILDGEATMDISVHSSDTGSSHLRLLYSGTYRNGRRKGQGTFALKCDDKLLIEYSGQFDADLPLLEGKVTVPGLGVVSGVVTSPQKPDLYKLCSYFSLSRYYRLLELLGSKQLLPYICSFQGEVEIALDASFVREKFFQPLGLDYKEAVPTNYKGYITPELVLCGQSIVISSELFSYQGPISDNTLSGHGVLSLYEKDCNGRQILQERYEGIFVQSWRDGLESRQELPIKGEEYVGAFHKNVRHGPGRLLLTTTGDIYEGNFVEGHLEGAGKITYGGNDSLSAASYVGEFTNGLPHGNGTISFSDGSWYKGQFIAGKQTGVGTYYNSTEDTLTEGEFEDGKAQKHCTVIFRYSDSQNRRVVKGTQQTQAGANTVYAVSDNGYHYRGLLKDGLFHGEGLLEYSNGISYKGKFSKGKFSGLGKLTNPVYNYVLTANFYDGDVSLSGYNLLIYAHNETRPYSPHSHIKTYTGPMRFAFSKDHGTEGIEPSYCLTLGCSEDPYEFTLTSSNVAVVHYVNGDIYRGGFYADKRHGAGKAFSVGSGLLVIGTFRNDNLCGDQTILSSLGEIETGRYTGGVPSGRLVKFINGTSNRFRVLERQNEDSKGSSVPEKIIQPLQPIIVESTYENGNEKETVEIIFKSSDIRYIGEYVYGVFYGAGKAFLSSTSTFFTIDWQLKRLPEQFKKHYSTLCSARIEVLNKGHTDLSDSLRTQYSLALDEIDADASALTNPSITPSAYRCRITYPNSDYYEGETLDCMRHGSGAFYLSTGTLKYKGEYKEDKRCGNGTLVYKEKKVYVGEFLNDLRYGHGTMSYPNGSTYTGLYKEDLRSGLGKMTFPDGSVYEGMWRENEMWGAGTLVYRDGDRYEGEFASNMKHGRGIMHLINGDILEGTFAHDVMEGSDCKITYSNGDYYEGNVAAGMPHGEGTRRQKSGDVYIGEFSYGKYHGKGTLRYANGDVYVGHFVANKICGKGVMTYANGTVFEGEWMT
ncbi:Phosphatidylinositol-4-phosphate 5-kinase, putative [Giardia lamblia P15]|uniref:Phosphatidylinositol-4-phosphate 5-kinase, putative n=1 Tax=Giardia intestinalis (strain P15) TaxID=658858 RepID=E1EXP2_GIAIA|nr:Phosphatidylinositol-4-phosphate 5-kinase, putative [Giardia lamblia P15]